ncbi:MAG: hypothetical protein QOG53_204 [Frankiales bacterium]|jgi:hypothetical protein|nr:hypothetical protein [Frankiales bacterium]
MTTPRTAIRTNTGTTGAETYPQVSTSHSHVETAETKTAFKTTEMVFYVLAVVGVLIATQVVDGMDAKSGWLYVSLLTIGYMISRGLAKAGSYAKDHHNN